MGIMRSLEEGALSSEATIEKPSFALLFGAQSQSTAAEREAADKLTFGELGSTKLRIAGNSPPRVRILCYVWHFCQFHQRG
jgi:hypothetical protein